jgi:hypothetical protein
VRSAAYHLLDDYQHQEAKLPENGAIAGVMPPKPKSRRRRAQRRPASRL